MSGKIIRKSIKSILVILSFLIVVVSLIVFVALVALVFSKVFTKNASDGEKQVNDETYQILNYKPQTNEKYTGLITIPSGQIELKSEYDYVSYFDEDTGSHSLISNIGKEEYKCTGRCICDNDDSRKSAIAPLIIKRGLLYFLTAFSATVAYQLAKEHFTQECNEHFLSECPSGAIISEIDECEKKYWEEDYYPIDDDEYVPDLDKLTAPAKDEEKGDRSGIHPFLCEGHCILDEVAFLEWIDGVSLEVPRLMCREKHLSKEIFAYTTSDLGGATLNRRQLMDQARNVFIEVLSSLCPFAKFEVQSPRDVKDPKRVKTNHICVGYELKSSKKGVAKKINHSVHCREMEVNRYRF